MEINRNKRIAVLGKIRLIYLDADRLIWAVSEKNFAKLTLFKHARR